MILLTAIHPPYSRASILVSKKTHHEDATSSKTHKCGAEEPGKAAQISNNDNTETLSHFPAGGRSAYSSRTNIPQETRPTLKMGVRGGEQEGESCLGLG